MSESEEPLSKSARKRRSDDLQALGEALIELPQSELDALPLPDQLRDAVMLARRITKHGGLYRQRQYIGKLMRRIDAEPIRAALEAKRDRERLVTLRFRRVEHWRDRLLREGEPALAPLAEEAPGIDVAAIASLLARARSGKPGPEATRAARELFGLLREALAKSATIAP